MVQHHPQRLSWRHSLALLCLVIVGLALARQIFVGYAESSPISRSGHVPASTAARRPIQFIANRGQTDSSVRFTAHVLGGTAFFTQDEIVLSLPSSHESREVVRLRFQSPNPQRRISSPAQPAGQIHFLKGASASAWRTHVPAYSSISYQALYAGIDLRFDGTSSGLKGTYVIAPGADPGRIRWQYTGVQQVSIDADGSLELALGGEKQPGWTLRESAPIAWQELNGRREPVAVQYDVAADQSIGFRLGAYNPRLPLIIDPEITYSTYLGGSFSDTGFNVRVDQDGYIYVVGETLSSDFPKIDAFQPTIGGDFDFFVSKIDPDDGSLVFSTLLGGSAEDRGRGIAVDQTGAVVVVGFSTSTNFPLVRPLRPAPDGIYQDGIIARLEPDGSRLTFSTYVGGNHWDQATRVAVGAAGRIYVSGATGSSNMVTTPGALQRTLIGETDAFIAALPADGSRWDYSTYLGGNGDEAGFGITVDDAGQAVLVGRTSSTNFPASADAVQTALRGGHDAFVAHLAANGDALLYSTYLGGSGNDFGHAIALDREGAVYISGDTGSSDFPVSQSAPQKVARGGGDAFATKIVMHNRAVVYSTYIGGANFEGSTGIAVTAEGAAFVAGVTWSPDFPVLYPLQPAQGGGEDIFVTGIDPAGTHWQISTFIGGDGSDIGRGIDLSSLPDHVFITGETQSAQGIQRCTAAGGCPTPLQAAYAGNRDGFVMELNIATPTPTPTATATATATPTTTTTPSPTATSVPTRIELFFPMVTEIDPF